VLAAALVLLAATAFAVSERNLRRTYTITPRDVVVPAGSASVQHGQHVARAITKCVECHGDDLGGKVYVDDPAIGRFVPVNLTTGKGGVGGQLKPADWERAVRHGVGRTERPLIFMPSQDFVTLSDEDLGAVIAWARQLPPVDRELPPSRVGPMGRVLNAAGKLPLAAQAIAHAAPTYAATAPTPGPTAEYGKYLANVGGCSGCHGEGFSGGHVPGTPPDFKPAANITPTGIGHYSEADFFRALREGVRPDGTKLDSFMPWKLAREMSDDEIRAVYAYLRTVPPKEFGNR
jgi:cytochrome c553